MTITWKRNAAIAVLALSATLLVPRFVLAADAIVLGWRGHGVVRRHLLGSVSRRVVRQAPCSVLVVRYARTDIRRVTVGFDGSPRSKRAVELVAGFSAQ